MEDEDENRKYEMSVLLLKTALQILEMEVWASETLLTILIAQDEALKKMQKDMQTHLEIEIQKNSLAREKSQKDIKNIIRGLRQAEDADKKLFKEKQKSLGAQVSGDTLGLHSQGQLKFQRMTPKQLRLRAEEI